MLVVATVLVVLAPDIFSHSPLLVVLFLWLVLFGALLILSSVLLISSFPPGLGSKGIGPRTKKMYTHCGPA